MGVITLWTRSPSVKYRSSFCSKGTLFLALCTMLTFVPPLLIGYRSNGFWLKTSIYKEQPDVNFKHNMIAVMDTSGPEHYLAWSTSNTMREMVGSKFRVPVISSYEDDANSDGKNDELHLTLDFPLVEGEAVHGMKLLLSFEVGLYMMTRLKLSGLAYISCTSALPGSRLTVFGDLQLHQREPVRHKGFDDRYKEEMIPANSLDPSDYDIAYILQQYTRRNLTTKLENQYSIWSPNEVNSFSFAININIKYPLQTIEYTPGVWQVLKMAWVQYLSLLALFALMFRVVKEYVFTNKLVPTWSDVTYIPNKYD